MNAPEPTIRSYLYVPGDDERKIEKALASEADAVVLDLEDAVAPSRKEEARGIVSEVLRAQLPKPVLVRVNAAGSQMRERDVEAAANPLLYGLRLPKTESADEVRAVADTLLDLGCEAGLQVLIESALGLEMAFELARAHGSVIGLSLGEADLSADLGVRDERGLLYARSRVVSASRAAGLPNPSASVYTDIRDGEGLRRSSEEARDLGFVGRSAIHPSQVAIINEVFTSTDEEVAEASDLLEQLREAAEAGTGAFALPDGRFVDEAVVRRARSTLALARREVPR